VEQPEEAAAEPEPERRRGFRLVEERRIVQPQLLERLAKLGVLVSLYRIQAREDHRLQLFETGKRLGRRARCVRDRVADLRVADLLDVRDEKPDLAHSELVDDDGFRGEDADLL